MYFDEANVSFINYTDNFQELKNSIARINVYYEDLSYVHVEDKEAVSFVSLIGTLGGNLGLFLGKYMLNSFFSTNEDHEIVYIFKGASVLSFVEVFKLFYELTRELIKWTLERKRTSKIKLRANVKS
jgi:hypothetical protein